MRRQVTVSWDSGGSDEAPPKVRHYFADLCVCVCLIFMGGKSAVFVLFRVSHPDLALFIWDYSPRFILCARPCFYS